MLKYFLNNIGYMKEMTGLKSIQLKYRINLRIKKKMSKQNIKTHFKAYKLIKKKAEDEF